MVDFVTLQQASDHLRRDTTDDDNDLKLKITSASAAVKNYIKTTSPYVIAVDTAGDPVLDSAGDPVPEEDTAGDPIIRPEVIQATLAMVGIFYRDRDGQEMEKWELGFLPNWVSCILYPLRTPTMA